MTQDVELGYGILLMLEALHKLRQAEVYPIDCQDQLTITECNYVIPKKRVAHKLLFNRKEGKKINQQVRNDDLQEIMFCHVVLWFLHLIHHLRWHPLNEWILCKRIDVEKAYRQLHTTVAMSTKCISIWFLDNIRNDQYTTSTNQVVVLLTHLPFGSSPAKSKFTSKMALDLSGDLLCRKEWNPTTLPLPPTQP